MPIVSLSEAKVLLENGELLAFPTETVYGLGCRPDAPKAVANLFAIKDRSAKAGMPVLISEAALVEHVIAPESAAQREQRLALQEQYWPGPLSIIVQCRDKQQFPEGVASADTAVALRLSSSSLARELAAAAGGFLIATSANPAGKPAAIQAAEAAAYFPELAVLAAGPDHALGSEVSTVVDAREVPLRLLRQGACRL